LPRRATRDVHDHVLRMRACRWCRRAFYICRCCDRGHAYCGDECRASGRRRDVREARARYRQSPEAREDHRERMRDWRRKRREAAPAVSDQPSATVVAADKVPSTKEVDDVHHEQIVRLRAVQRCVVCAREGKWARWFPSRCWGRLPLSGSRR
jgi:hypothetical protein